MTRFHLIRNQIRIGLMRLMNAIAIWLLARPRGQLLLMRIWQLRSNYQQNRFQFVAYIWLSILIVSIFSYLMPFLSLRNI